MLYSYLIVLHLISSLTNLILAVSICIILTMTAETAWKLNFYPESMVCLEPRFKKGICAKVFLVKLLDKLKIVEEF